jgi:hypothetical protein
VEDRQCRIEDISDEDREKSLKAFDREMEALDREQHAAAKAAIPCLERLVKVMRSRSGQPYKIRQILFSLWNGKPARINHVLNLDWALRKDLCAVIMAFGYESEDVKFFYNAIEAEVKRQGQWEWFLEERNINHDE